MIGTWDDAAVFTIRETVTRMTSSMGTSLILLSPGGRKSEALARLAVRALPGHLLNDIRIAYLDDGRPMDQYDYRRMAELLGSYASLDRIETTPEEQQLLQVSGGIALEALLGLPSLHAYMRGQQVRTIITGHADGEAHVRSYDLCETPVLRRPAWELFPTLLASDRRDRMRFRCRQLVVTPMSCWTNLEWSQLEAGREFAKEERHLVVCLSWEARRIFLSRILKPHVPLEVSKDVFVTQDEDQVRHRWIVTPGPDFGSSRHAFSMNHVIPHLGISDNVIVLGHDNRYRKAASVINMVLSIFSAHVGRINTTGLWKTSLYDLLREVRPSIFKRDYDAFYGQLDMTTDILLGVSPVTLAERTYQADPGLLVDRRWKLPETIQRFPSKFGPYSFTVFKNYHARNPDVCVREVPVSVLGKRDFWKGDDIRISQLGRTVYIKDTSETRLTTKDRTRDYRLYTGTLSFGAALPAFFDDLPFVVYSDEEILGCGQFIASHNCVL